MKHLFCRDIFRVACVLLMAGVGGRVQAGEAVLLRNGVIHTASARGTIAGASVLIVDGRVTAIGKDVSAPDDAKVVDLHGRPVTPALFGGINRLGVLEVSGESVTDDSTLKLGQMRPEFDPGRAFNPDSLPVQIARAEGIGFAVVAPGVEGGTHGVGGSSLVSGLARVVRLDGRAPRPPAALAVLVDADGGALSGSSRAATWMLLEQALEEARGQTTLAAGEERLLTPAGRRVLRGFVAEGKPLLIEANRASDIRATVEFAEREKLKVVIRGGAEAWRVAALLKRADVPVVLDPLADLPSSFDQLGATLENAAKLHAAGVTIAFSLSTDEPHNVRTLRQAAGIAVAHGLPWDAALEAITSVPARVFRAADEYGAIEVGRPANVVVWSGDPLEVTSLVEDLWLNGEHTSVRSRQTELRDRYLPRVRAGTAR